MVINNSVHIEENRNGWCATDLDQDGKIKKWGFCNEQCEDDSKHLRVAKLNILNSMTECQYLINISPAANITNFNPHLELCLGQKHNISTLLSFKRENKTEQEKEEQKLKALASKKIFCNI